MEGWTKTTLYIDAENEQEAEEKAQLETAFDSTDVCQITEIQGAKNA